MHYSFFQPCLTTSAQMIKLFMLLACYFAEDDRCEEDANNNQSKSREGSVDKVL